MMTRALNTYSLRNEWDTIAKKSLQSVVKLCHDLDLDQLEFLDTHFKRESLKEAMKFLKDNGIHVFALGPHVHLLAQQKDIPKMIEQGNTWLKLAAECGVGKVRFQVGDGPFPKAFPPMPDFGKYEWDEYYDQMEEAAKFTGKVIEPLLETAEQVGVIIGIETHHSYSSNYIYQEYIRKLYASPKLGWVFDIGNYENDDMRWKSLDVIKSRIVYWHAKAYAFTEAGLEKTIDFPRGVQICHEAGFSGELSIEFEGKMNGILGVLKTNELLKYSIAATQGQKYVMKTQWPGEKELNQKYRQ
jgi:sugar phosphate isomerase/epimerase